MMIKKVVTATLISSIFLIGCGNEAENVKKTTEKTVVETNGEAIENIQEDIHLPNEDLQLGDSGEAVSALQQALIEIGYPIEITGNYDERTTWAITDIQLQTDATPVSGMYGVNVKNVLGQMLDGTVDITVGKNLKEPIQPDEFSETIENPYEVLVLVNKDYSLPADFEPNDLTVPNVPFPFAEDDPKKQLRQEAAEALEELFAASEKDGLSLYAQSGYRSYERQEAIFASNVEKHGESHANTYSAKAGESEHQSGLVMDVTAQEVGFDLITDFGETEEGKWIKDHAHEYGFIIRYPKGKEEITKYQYEPWHLRYVGEKAATEITNDGLTLEEYLGAK